MQIFSFLRVQLHTYACTNARAHTHTFLKENMCSRPLEHFPDFEFLLSLIKTKYLYSCLFLDQSLGLYLYIFIAILEYLLYILMPIKSRIMVKSKANKEQGMLFWRKWKSFQWKGIKDIYLMERREFVTHRRERTF